MVTSSRKRRRRMEFEQGAVSSLLSKLVGRAIAEVGFNDVELIPVLRKARHSIRNDFEDRVRDPLIMRELKRILKGV